MAVAKSYEDMEQITEPFEDEGKMYVKVRGNCPRCGGSGHYSYNQMDGTRCYGCNGTGKQVQTVRWYTDAQRAALDRAAEKRQAAAKVKQEERRVKFAARNAFGFGKDGFITIIYGDYDTIQNWRDTLPMHTVWYNTIFGWFIPSDRTVEEIPESINSFRLEWNDVINPEDSENLAMKDNDEVKLYVQKLIYGESKSTYQGEVNEWLERAVTIKRNIALESRFGASHMHIMEDADGNVYVWTTSSKSIEEGKTVNMKMKVKEHKEYEGVPQTIVYYCKIK